MIEVIEIDAPDEIQPSTLRPDQEPDGEQSPAQPESEPFDEPTSSAFVSDVTTAVPPWLNSSVPPATRTTVTTGSSREASLESNSVGSFYVEGRGYRDELEEPANATAEQPQVPPGAVAQDEEQVFQGPASDLEATVAPATAETSAGTSLPDLQQNALEGAPVFRGDSEVQAMALALENKKTGAPRGRTAGTDKRRRGGPAAVKGGRSFV